MMSEQTPELRWAPIEPKPKNTGRVWLIIGISVAALAIVGALLFFLLPRGEEPAPAATSTPSPTTTSTPSPSASASATPTPQVTPPAPVDPTVDAFREQVGGWLTDAPRGLDIVAGTAGDAALSVVSTLEEDARRLSDAQPPSSIAQQWRDGVDAYAKRLAELRTAITDGSDTAASIGTARAAVTDLQTLVGF
ncbi:hypothetical protein F6W70_05855 [Microbacterium maritypicum]|uniref:Uncharacterized protein n=2 Tax=Microbacterium maritypicum TaxID=33918 RepID=A0AAD3ZZU7_MICMQ|nr:hypothetical protein F6W70_05855 [Microbacterium liquefaciens]